MVQLTHSQAAALRPWFLPDQPGPMVGLHVLHSKLGKFFTDRWPDPRALLVEIPWNYELVGDPNALTTADLQGQLKGVVVAAPQFQPLLQASFPDMQIWPRVILSHQDGPPGPIPSRLPIRRIRPEDAERIALLDEETAWISNTWGGQTGLAASGYAWVALDGDRLAAVACTFFLGERYEDIGVITEPAYRRQGLSSACTAALMHDIYARGHCPSWSTSPDNLASLRVARKLGFQPQRNDHLYVINAAIPPAPV